MPESREKQTEQNQSIDRKKCRPRWIGFAVIAAWLAAMAMTLPASADMEPAEGGGEQPQRYLFIRPHAGVGWASAYNRSGNALALHAGGRVLFPSPLSPKVDAKFGLEATYLQLDITGDEIFSERYAAVGVVLEMTVVRGFNLGVGTLGYIGVRGTDRNPFGIVTNLGWEPLWDSRVRPYITMRSEWIFDRATYNVLSLSAGVTFGI